MRNIILLVLGLAIIQDQVLIEAKDKTEDGKGAPRLISTGRDYQDSGPVKLKCKF